MKKMDCRYVVASTFLLVFCIICILHISIQHISNTGGLAWNVHHRLNYQYVLNAYGEKTHGRLNSTGDSTLKDGKDKNNSSGHFQSNKKSSMNWIKTLSTLLFDSFSSIYRMFTALGISFVTALSLGILAARNSIASKIIIPIVDILQSVPILGFFPAAIAFFITLFNKSPIGIESAAIFLIFTSMVWNMIFSVYESVMSIPTELLETTNAYRANPLLKLRRLYLPASIPKLVYNSIMSWAGGWYFLTAAEIISLGSNTFKLNGLGSLLATSVSSGHIEQAMIALSMLIIVIMIIDLIFWRPLQRYANRFNYNTTSSFDTVSLKNGSRSFHNLNNDNITKLFRSAIMSSSSHLSNFNIDYRFLIHSNFDSILKFFMKLLFSIELPINLFYCRFTSRLSKKTIKILLVLISIFLLSIGLYYESPIIHKSFVSLYRMTISLNSDPKSVNILVQLPLALLLSYLRLAAAYVITLCWTIPVAIMVVRSPKFSHIMFAFQTFAAIPATAFFPFSIAAINFVPGGFEFLSIMLILTGMQWYVLFNLIGGLRSMPGNLEETARAFRSTKIQYFKKILFPSIYPSFITGSITGWGGGWNALIVAEYLVLGNKTYSVLGIGSLLDKASYSIGNTMLVLLIVGIMSTVIVLINRLIWRRLYQKVIKKYSFDL